MKQEGKKFNLLSLVIISIFFISLFTLSSFATSYLPGDFVGPMGDLTPDGKVDFNDLMVFATAYGSEKGDANWNPLCDICGYLGDPNPDDKVNFDDLMVFATNYGKEIEVIIPEPIEAISQEIDLSIGGIVEVTDPENIIYGVKLIIPPIPSEKRGGKSTATMTISYIDNPYSLELPDNRGFLLPPVVINSDVSLDVKCTLEIPYTEADLNNMGLFSNENIIIYHYNYTSSSWEEVTANRRSYKDKNDLDYIAEEKLIKIFYPPFGLDWMPEQMLEDSIYVCSYAEVPPSIDPGFPQPGDLLYRKSNVGGIDGWIPGHVGIYVGEKFGDYDNDPSTPDEAYNVIEALHKKDGIIVDKVMANYYNPISEFAGKFNTIYMGATQPDFGALTSKQRSDVLEFLVNNDVIGKPYAWFETRNFYVGLARGELVKGLPPKGLYEDSYNCVGLAEAAYEYAGINGEIGLVSDEDEGNNCFVYANGMASPRCVLTPAEQYAKTEPAEGYTVSGRVTDSQGVGIPDVTLNFELVSFNNYHDSFKLTTDSNGDWSSGKLGREWNVTPQKDGYTFEPSTKKVKEDANDIDFTSTSEPEILTPEEIELIREWGYGGDYVIRWPDGYVDVYDETNYSQMQEVLNQWNAAIDGPVSLRLSSNPNSPVKVYYDQSLDQEGICGNWDIEWGEDYALSMIDVRINPYCESYNYPLYLFMFKNVVGFAGWTTKGVPYEEWTNFTTINDTMKKMVHALHKVYPGYYLGESKLKINQTSTVTEDMRSNAKGRCATNYIKIDPKFNKTFLKMHKTKRSILTD